jgi:PST family polysaccharide transporter
MNIYKLFKISGLSAISTTIKTLVGIGITKLIAIYIGAEGLAFIGNLKNVLTSVTGLSTGGIDNGITSTLQHPNQNLKEIRYSTHLFS